MNFKEFCRQLNPLSRCRKYEISAFQCPEFLFVLMGLIIIASIIVSYFILSKRIKDPETVILTILSITAFLIIIDYIITRSFERLAESSRMKTEFISIASHQLRTPLTNLKYTIETLVSDDDFARANEGQMEYFDILKANIERMNKLINDLLTVSRLESGKMFYKKQLVSIEEIARKAIAKIKPFSDRKQINVALDVKGDLPKISVDPSCLEQVIENLLDNSVRYTKGTGDVKILIKPKFFNKIYFAIKDKGVGIPRGEGKYIFQKFFRSRNTLRLKTQGSGLGLYISKKLIEIMGGKIGFSSEANKGSTFWFILPVKNSQIKN